MNIFIEIKTHESNIFLHRTATCLMQYGTVWEVINLSKQSDEGDIQVAYIYLKTESGAINPTIFQR